MITITMFVQIKKFITINFSCSKCLAKYDLLALKTLSISADTVDPRMFLAGITNTGYFFVLP